ncbi:MAG: glycosyltransferase family 4 protein, partial [Candidatus Nanohaloarchaea archaeon]|nr:glycosyltransferase family 4 protein [Candidatus Nanohaloarchaea archaeon]
MAKQTRILLTTHTFLPEHIGGAEYLVKYLSEELASRGEEPIIVGPPRGAEEIAKQENGFPKYIESPYSGIRNKLQTIRRIRRAYIDHDIDIVHSHFAYPAGFLTELALLGKPSPHVITSHGADVFKMPNVGGYRFDRKKEHFIRWTLKRCDRHIMISDAMKEHAVEAGSSESKMVKIRNPSPPIEEISSEDVEETLQKFDLENSSYVLTMCRHVPQKGLSYLINAFDSLADDYPELQLVIGSDGEKRDDLEALVGSLGLKDRVT